MKDVFVYQKTRIFEACVILLHDEINDLREQFANLNTVLLEQIRVIMNTLKS